MSKKKVVYLKIKDREEFRKRLNLATIESCCVVADVEELLKDHELDVIGFEATVFELPRPMANIIYTPAELKEGEKYDFFVVKPKKAEVKDEKEKT